MRIFSYKYSTSRIIINKIFNFFKNKINEIKTSIKIFRFLSVVKWCNLAKISGIDEHCMFYKLLSEFVDIPKVLAKSSYFVILMTVASSEFVYQILLV
jgi:RIO-like serine/threonine protein kinase